MIMDHYKKLSVVMQEGNDIQYLVHNFPSKPWDWKTLSINPGITWEFVPFYV